MSLEDFKSLSEITNERKYNQKAYDIGNGQKRYRIHCKHGNGIPGIQTSFFKRETPKYFDDKLNRHADPYCQFYNHGFWN